MMDIEKMLTNESLKKKKPELSTFDLVTWAIQRAQNMIRTGRDGYVKTESQSRAVKILAEIANGKDVLDHFEEEGEDDESAGVDFREFSDIATLTAERNSENREPVH